MRTVFFPQSPLLVHGLAEAKPRPLDIILDTPDHSGLSFHMLSLSGPGVSHHPRKIPYKGRAGGKKLNEPGCSQAIMLGTKMAKRSQMHLHTCMSTHVLNYRLPNITGMLNAKSARQQMPSRSTNNDSRQCACNWECPDGQPPSCAQLDRQGMTTSNVACPNRVDSE